MPEQDPTSRPVPGPFPPRKRRGFCITNSSQHRRRRESRVEDWRALATICCQACPPSSPSSAGQDALPPPQEQRWGSHWQSGCRGGSHLAVQRLLAGAARCEPLLHCLKLGCGLLCRAFAPLCWFVNSVPPRARWPPGHRPNERDSQVAACSDGRERCDARGSGQHWRPARCCDISSRSRLLLPSPRRDATAVASAGACQMCYSQQKFQLEAGFKQSAQAPSSFALRVATTDGRLEKAGSTVSPEAPSPLQCAPTDSKPCWPSIQRGLSAAASCDSQGPGTATGRNGRRCHQPACICWHAGAGYGGLRLNLQLGAVLPPRGSPR